MSLSYAESLSYFPHKGKVGMPELCETQNDLNGKLEILVQMIRESQHTVAVTGAGISTDAGIPDFRGPNGVWTLEKRGEKPSFNVSFEKATPTYTHQALCTLEQNNYLHFVISQNIDGLHHRSGFPLDKLAELHGNVFVEECDVCHTQMIRPTCVGSFCRKRTGNVCNSMKSQKKHLKCRGKLRDTVLDWEDPLPETALKSSEQHCSKADLCLCLGTSLQIRPCRDLPKRTKKNHGKLVIINLQKTSLDSIADLVIHERCDRVMKYVIDKLNINSNDISTVKDESKYNHVEKVLLISGKEKTGKNFLATKLKENLNGLLLNMNDILKHEYEKDNFQDDFTKWCEDKSRNDPTKSSRLLIEQNEQMCLKHSIWIINEIKSKEEIEFFKDLFNNRLFLIRIEASNDSREQRGWKNEINNVRNESECQLFKSFQWSFVFVNDQYNNFDEQMNDLLKTIKS